MNSSRSWELYIDHKVSKALGKIPKEEVKKITGAIRALPDNPYAGDIRKVRGEETVWRRRVGEIESFTKCTKTKDVLMYVGLNEKDQKHMHKNKDLT